MTFFHLRGVSCNCGLSILNLSRISPSPLSLSLPWSWGKGCRIRGVHKINQQELALKQLICLNIAPYTNNTNYISDPASCHRNSSGRWRYFIACLRDLFFIGVGLFSFKISITIVTFTIHPLCHHFYLFPQIPIFSQQQNYQVYLI